MGQEVAMVLIVAIHSMIVVVVDMQMLTLRNNAILHSYIVNHALTIGMLTMINNVQMTRNMHLFVQAIVKKNL